MIDEARAVAASHSVPLMWILTGASEPADLPSRLARRGIRPDPRAPETATMVLGSGVDLGQHDTAIAIEDGLLTLEAFAATARIQAGAFGDQGPADHSDETFRIRWEEARQTPAERLFLARVEGRPAGGGWVTVDGLGALLGGGAVASEFRGRGVYRALVAARYRAALEAGAAGLVTHAGPMSRPVLEKLGFRAIGSRRYFKDSTPWAGA